MEETSTPIGDLFNDAEAVIKAATESVVPTDLFNDAEAVIEAASASVVAETKTAAPKAAEAKAPAVQVMPAEPAQVDTGRGRRKERVGKVVSDKMEKTCVVTLVRQVPHPLYKKYFKKTTKFVAHNEGNDAKVGDTVRIMETRPLSRTKRWRVVEVIERAK